MTQKSKELPPGHVETLTEEQIREARHRIRRGSVDSGLTLPVRKISTEPFDATSATPAERDAKARELGIRIKEH